MKISEIIKAYVNKKDKPREIGRYFSSELFGIINNYLKPQDFFKPRQIDEMGSKYISEGVAIEDYLTKVFTEQKIPVDCQAKKEIVISEGVVLVAKCDYYFGDYIVELKRPANLSSEIPPKWQYQLEAYARVFELPVYLWQVYYPLTIKQLKYTPCDKRWEKIKEKLLEFHEEIIKIKSKKNDT